MRAKGVPPQVLVLLDDTVFDAQCCADSQMLNTSHMLECFEEVFADGRVDESDAPLIIDLYRHVKLEHHLNTDQLSLMKWARHHTNKVAALVAGYRERLQDMKKAAGRSGLTENPARQG